MKIWRSEEKGDDKIIAYFDNMIYRVNPKPGDIEQVLYDFTINKAPIKDFIGIPLNYVREINLEDGKEYIVVLFNKDSYEHLKIKDQSKRIEIFEYFKNNLPKTTFLTDRYSKMRAGKKPIIAMCIILALCIWTFYVSTGMEEGNQYEVVGKQNSVAGIVLTIAALGTTNVLLLFGFLFAIALTSFIYKTKRPKIVHKIIV